MFISRPSPHGPDEFLRHNIHKASGFHPLFEKRACVRVDARFDGRFEEFVVEFVEGFVFC
jgi:hypothetical protein